MIYDFKELIIFLLEGALGNHSYAVLKYTVWRLLGTYTHALSYMIRTPSSSPHNFFTGKLGNYFYNCYVTFGSCWRDINIRYETYDSDGNDSVTRL